MAAAVEPLQARAILLHAAGLDRDWPEGDEGVRAVLDHLEVIQLDPIDRCGQNADLVVGARVPGVKRGQVHRALRGLAFEHFAKERCLVHARHFADYREQAVETPWWRNDERARKVPQEVLGAVLAEVKERGPISGADLTRRGSAEPMDWSGWKSTSRLEVLAIELLWSRCLVVASGRDARGQRVYDTPERAMGAWAQQPPPGPGFHARQLLARVAAAGLLSRATGPQWSMLRGARTDGTIDVLLKSGALVEVSVAKRTYLTLPRFLDLNAPAVTAAAALRPAVLAPLDPLLWDRNLVQAAFDFEYVWEVYKPEGQRKWGYYVCPVLLGGTLAARVECRRESNALVVQGRWGAFDHPDLTVALRRLAAVNDRYNVDVSSARSH